MFDGYDLKNSLPTNTVIIKKPLNSNEHSYSLGLPKWQQTYTTSSRMAYTQKDLRNNKADLESKIYLQPNHSNFDIGYMGNKNIYQTSNKNDYHLYGMTQSEQNQFQSKYIPPPKKNEEILNNDLNNKNKSIYSLLMQNPKEQKINYDYDNIHFKYNQYNIDPITGREILKDPNNCWGYEYYNKDKGKGHINAKLMEEGINNEINQKKRKKKYSYMKKQVWDPITNRFFECSGE